MIAYEDMLTNFGPLPGSVFPDVEAINVSAPAAGDGSEWIAAWANDHMGARQALMDHVGLTPNAVGEGAGASQFLDAINSYMPAGTVIAWHGQTDMSNFGRWIQLEGQTVLVADYLDLVASCYIGDGNNNDTGYPAYYKSSDAGGITRTTAGTYFTLPDSRGNVLRGYDPSGNTDPDGPFRSFPDYQQFALQEHVHRIEDTNGGAEPYVGLFGVTLTPGASSISFYDRKSTFAGLQTEEAISGANSSADETRMDNVQAKFAVRY